MIRVAALVVLAAGSILAPAAARANEASPKLDQLAAARAGLAKCLSDNAVRLGGKNAEAGDLVLKASKASCVEADKALVDAWDAIPMSRRMIEPRLQADREAAENAAAAALLEARTAR